MYLFETPTFHSNYKGRQICRYLNGYYCSGHLKADTLRGIKFLINQSRAYANL